MGQTMGSQSQTCTSHMWDLGSRGIMSLKQNVGYVPLVATFWENVRGSFKNKTLNITLIKFTIRKKNFDV